MQTAEIKFFEIEKKKKNIDWLIDETLFTLTCELFSPVSCSHPTKWKRKRVC